MANNFLKVEKSLFGSGLSPIEILVLSQIMEFDRNTGDCFISNAVMAKNFGVSEKTVSRAVASLEEKGLISRNTRNIQKGKERHIILTKDKMTLVNENEKSTKDKLSLAEKTNCPLRNGQNDPIKDNNKNIKEKDNIEIDEKYLPSVGIVSSISENQPQEIEAISPEALIRMGARYEITQDDLIRIIDTGKLFRIKQ
jgi:predicted transcriptional regulator